MANFKINSRSTVIVFVAVALALAAALVVYLNRPVRRVSLPKGTAFPACLFELNPLLHTCDESTTCIGEAPGGLTYGKHHTAVAGEGKNWCCPDGTHGEDRNNVMVCVVD